MTTKPLIQQLAERIGWPPGNATLQAIAAAHAAPSFIFELCAYLDERDQADRQFEVGQRVELDIGGQWRSGQVSQLGLSADRLLVRLDVQFRDEDSYWVSDCHVRHWQTRAEQKRPPPPDELVGALHDPIHPPSGNLISASPVRVVRRVRPEIEIQDDEPDGPTCGASLVCDRPPGHDNGCHDFDALHRPAAPEVAEPDHGFAHCGHGYASGSPNCVQCDPTKENITYLVNQHRHLKEDLAEARAELASRCDHHAAIHELNRELVEARQDRATGERISAESIESWSKLRAAEAELAKVTAERDAMRRFMDIADGVNVTHKDLTSMVESIANLQVERDQLKSARDSAENLAARLAVEVDGLKRDLAWEKAWDLHTKVAMGAVVEAARAVYRRIDAEGKLEYHGHSYRPGDCSSCQELNALRDALTAAAAKPPEP